VLPPAIYHYFIQLILFFPEHMGQMSLLIYF